MIFDFTPFNRSSSSTARTTRKPTQSALFHQMLCGTCGSFFCQSGTEYCRSASRDYSVIDWQKKDPQIPQSIWWNNADWVGFRVVRAVEEYEVLQGLKSKITKQSAN